MREVFSVVRHDHAARAGGDDLVAVEAVHADVAHRARHLSGERTLGVTGAERLGGVLDEDEVVLLGNFQQPRHRGHVAEHVHDDHRLDVRARRLVDAAAPAHLGVGLEVFLHERGADAQAVAAADEDGLGARVAHGVDGGDERQRRHDHLVAAPDAGREHREVQAGRAGVARHGARRAAVVGDGLFKFRHKAAAGGHPLADDGVVDILVLVAAEIRHGQRDEFRFHYVFPLFFRCIALSSGALQRRRSSSPKLIQHQPAAAAARPV